MTSALLVIDAQKIYTDPQGALHCDGADKTLRKINKLIRLFKKRKQPIVYIQHVHKKDGSDAGRMFDFAGTPEPVQFKEGSSEAELSEGLVIDKKQKFITKNRYSSFVGTDLENHLKDLGVKRVVVTGYMTNFCCESAARDAHDRDFYVDFILDATGTPGVEGYDQRKIRKAVAAMLSAGFATVYNTTDYVAKE